MDYVDLYLLHWPLKGMRPVEIMAALAEVVQSGKARYLGCSNFPAWLLAHCNASQPGRAGRNWSTTRWPTTSSSAASRWRSPQAVADGIAITAYRPIAEGVLAGRYQVGGPFPAARGEAAGRSLPGCRNTATASSGSFVMRRTRVPPAALALAWLRYSRG